MSETQEVVKEEVPQVIGLEKPLKVRLIKLIERRGSLFPGETGGWPDPIAQRMIDEKVGIEVDAEGNAIEVPTVLAVNSIVADQMNANHTNDDFVFDEKRDPFIADGISKTASLALHRRGLHTPVAVSQFIADGGDVNDIKDINDTQAEKINKRYGHIDDDNDLENKDSE